MFKQRTKLLSCILSVIVLSLAPASSFVNANTFHLKYAGLLPPGTTLSAPVDEWAKLVEDRTKGQVKTTTYHSQSLGKYREFPKLMKSGLCDMAFVAGGTPGFSLLSVIELPTLVSSMRISMDLVNGLYRTGYLSSIFEDKGFKLMFFMNSDPRMIWLNKKKVSRLSDLKGLKIRGISPVHIDVAKALGATAVGIAPADVYMALERGTVDGIMNPTEGIFAMKLMDSIKYVLWEPITADMTAVVMNLDVWNKLPAEARTVIQDVNAEMNYRYLNYYKTVEEDKARIREAGIEILEIDPDEKSAFYAALKPVVQNWLAGMEKMGNNGKEIYDEARNVLDQY